MDHRNDLCLKGWIKQKGELTLGLENEETRLSHERGPRRVHVRKDEWSTTKSEVTRYSTVEFKKESGEGCTGTESSYV